MLQGPLEQFEILMLICLKKDKYDFSLTNFQVIGILSGSLYMHICELVKFEKKFSYLLPHSWQYVVENVSNLVSQLVSDTILVEHENYWPLINLIFTFIFCSNLIGLIPYTITTTSHLILTFLLSFSIFVGINYITFDKYSIKIFSLFLPTNTTFFLALLLVPIEFVSYIAKPISLGVRLFINLMAGHTLLKVIIGFSWSIMLLETLLSIGLIVPMSTLIVLFGLELGVGLIQTYVFTILTCIYIQDAS